MIENADFKNKFLFESFAAFRAFLMYGGRLQACDLLGRLKCLAASLDASLFSESDPCFVNV